MDLIFGDAIEDSQVSDPQLEVSVLGGSTQPEALPSLARGVVLLELLTHGFAHQALFEGTQAAELAEGVG